MPVPLAKVGVQVPPGCAVEPRSKNKSIDGELIHNSTGLGLTPATGGSVTVIVTLLGVVFVQLGVPELVTLTMLMTVLLVKVLLKLAVPELFNTMV